MKKEKPTKLDELYSLRDNFSIIGLTGRTGSGCSEVAKILETEFNALSNVVNPKKNTKLIKDKKYEIVYNFNKQNWVAYKTISYRDVLFLLILHNLESFKLRDHLNAYFKKSFKEKQDKLKINSLHIDLHAIFKEHKEIREKIIRFKNLGELKKEVDLKFLAKLFWDKEFTNFAKKIDLKLKEYGLLERIFLLHHTALNFRKTGKPYKSSSFKHENIYYIAKVINRIIKGVKLNYGGTCHVVVDSLQNSSEINFFKERYSGFYLVAVKSENRKKRLLIQYENDLNIVDKLLEIDDVEYKCNDFAKGNFFSPDVQNCIQKADFHIITRNEEKNEIDFYSLEQQLLKFQGLIKQPGLITPSTVERSMQFAFNAKLNSGCISRQVGAVITDQDFSVKAIGWNDVPRGTVPCAVRNILDVKNKNPFGFSEFEKGNGMSEGVNIQGQNPDNNEVDKESKEFHEYLIQNYNSKKISSNSLGGINCSYCFKTAYNKFKGESNQVHTRSLHAEENAMMQISKYGGQPLNHGVLFTTASPCELCSKKAYQLGIKDIYFIDPYPGISRSHILRQGINKVGSDPNLHMFYGAIGRGFIKLYEPYLAQKDELSILTDHKLETPAKVRAKQLKDFLESQMSEKPDLKKKLDIIFENDSSAFNKIVNIIEENIEKLVK